MYSTCTIHSHYIEDFSEIVAGSCGSGEHAGGSSSLLTPAGPVCFRPLSTHRAGLRSRGSPPSRPSSLVVAAAGICGASIAAGSARMLRAAATALQILSKVSAIIYLLHKVTKEVTVLDVSASFPSPPPLRTAQPQQRALSPPFVDAQSPSRPPATLAPRG